MYELSSSEWVYIIAITFQLTGAILLLIKYSFVNIEKGIQDNRNKETRIENDFLYLGSTQPTAAEYKENVWLNRIAFAYIAIGYLINVWGAIECGNKIKIFSTIVILSVVFSLLSLFISRKLSNYKRVN